MYENCALPREVVYKYQYRGGKIPIHSSNLCVILSCCLIPVTLVINNQSIRERKVLICNWVMAYYPCSIFLPLLTRVAFSFPVKYSGKLTSWILSSRDFDWRISVNCCLRKSFWKWNLLLNHQLCSWQWERILSSMMYRLLTVPGKLKWRKCYVFHRCWRVLVKYRMGSYIKQCIG